jgi:hypothetical protein
MTARRLAVALVVLGAVPASAEAAGVEDLNRVLFDRPYVEVLGASPAGVLYSVSRDENHSPVQVVTWVKPAGAPAYQVDTTFRRLAGDKIFGWSPTGATYQFIGSPATLRCDAAPQPVPPAQRYDNVGLFASFGWISSNGDRVVAGPNGCTATPAYRGIGEWSLIAMDETGYLLIGSAGDGDRKTLTYYAYADPTHPRVVATGGHDTFVGAVSLSGTSVAWSVLDYTEQPTTSSYVVRSSTDGSRPPVATRLPGRVVGTAIAGGATAWTTCQGVVDCATGSIAADGTRTQSSQTRSAIGDGARFVFDNLQPTPGIDAAAAIGGTAARTRLAAIDLLPPVAHAVSVGAGGAAYVDSQLPAEAVSRRFYTRPTGAVTLTEQVKIGQAGAVRSVSREGRRTAFVDSAGVLWLVTDDGVRTRVFAPVAREAIVGSNALRISGSRLLWWKAVFTRDDCHTPVCVPLYDFQIPMIYDLRTGVSTVQNLPADSYGTVDLWGNYLVWADGQNAVWRRDLASGALLQAKAAGSASVRSVAVHDDWVAWATCASDGDQDECAQSVVGHRNLQTKAAAILVASAHTRTVRMSGGHVVYDTAPGYIPSNGTLKVGRLGTSATGVVGPISAYKLFDVHDETLAWVGTDSVARIGPNSPFVAYPKYLGNGSAPPSFNPALRVWNAEFGISKALPTCTVTIRSGTTVRRTLNCATTNGSARADWDGRDSAGRLLPPGAYSWTLAGRDGDGTLRWWTGATHAITGTVRIVS